MLLRLADPERRLAAVRLCCDLPLARTAFARAGGEWRLALPRLPVARLEYELEVTGGDGRARRVPDPAEPRRAGARSVRLLPGYRPPAWLGEDGVLGSRDGAVWSPAGADPDEPLPLLVAHDGPEYDRAARLTHYAAAAIRAGRLPRHRVALLAARDRNEAYSASADYADALAREVLPALPPGPRVGMGASLGALAMLHAEHQHPGTFRALFLQSGSYFTPRHDGHEVRFARYERIVAFVEAVRAIDVPAALTCGAPEENVHNNRLMARRLGVALHETPDLHNFTNWRDALEPHLTRLLARVW